MIINRKPQFIRVKDQLIEIARVSEIEISSDQRHIDVEGEVCFWKFEFVSEEECRKAFESVVKQLAKGGYYLS